MSRFEEVVNDAIGEVIVGGSGFRAEQLAQRVASWCAFARAHAGRGHDRSALPRAPPLRFRNQHAGDLHAVRVAVASERELDASSASRRRESRLSVRAGACRRPRAPAAR